MTLSPLKKLSESPNYKWWVFLAIAIGLFTSVSDFGSLIVALPTIANHFGTDLPTTQWVLIGYSLTISALLLPMGRLADIIGRKKVYLIGFSIFIVGGIAAGFSQNVQTLILFKVIQGVGASMTQGTGMAIALSAFPHDERGRALGLQITTVGSGNILGPVLGGLIVGTLGWRWIFYVSVALSALVIVSALLILDARKSTGGRGGQNAFDWLGASLSTSALVTFLMIMTNAPRVGWASPIILAAMIALVSFIGSFVYWELRSPAPMMDVRQFKRRLFSMGVAAGFISFIGNSSVRFLIPFYLQAVLGYSPQKIGLIIVPSAIAMIVTGPLSGRLSDRFGWRPFTVGGLMFSVVGLLILSTLTPTSSVGVVILGMVMMMTGSGTFYPPNNASILSTVDESKYGVMSGFVNLIRNSGNITGIAVATAIVTGVMASSGFEPSLAAVSESGGAGVIEAFVSGLRLAYRIIAGLIVVAVILSFVRGGSVSESGKTEAEPEEVPAKPVA